jgi:hypothetical protein
MSPLRFAPEGRRWVFPSAPCQRHRCIKEPTVMAWAAVPGMPTVERVSPWAYVIRLGPCPILNGQSHPSTATEELEVLVSSTVQVPLGGTLLSVGSDATI